MKPSSEYIVKGIELVAGITVGVVTWIIINDGSAFSAILSIVVGLLISLIIIILVESFRQQNDIKVIKATYGNLIKLILEEQNRSENNLSYILKYGVVNFEDRYMPSVWRELLWNVKKCYYATNYIRSNEIYGQNWADAALAIQKAKSFGEQVEIKKVFIIDDDSELKDLSATFKKQIDAGINIRYILKRKFDEMMTLRFEKNEIQSIDFGIFDNKSVFLWKLDKRSIAGGGVIFKGDQVSIYKEFFKQLFLGSITAEAEDYD